MSVLFFLTKSSFPTINLSMITVLNDYIEKYIQDADSSDDKTIARHLKEIIPKTTHLEEKVFKKIVGELKNELDSRKDDDFKSAFLKVRKKFILKGDTIKAELPAVLIRIIPNTRKFLEYIANANGIKVEKLEKRISSRGIKDFIQYIGHLELAPGDKNVVFATFDEDHLENDPFINRKVFDIVNMLALHMDDSSNNEEPLTAVKLKYRNRKSSEKKFPTFIDAGWYRNFYPADEEDFYGRTKSLDKSLKNMPEVVHKNSKMSDVVKDIVFLKD